MLEILLIIVTYFLTNYLFYRLYIKELKKSFKKTSEFRICKTLILIFGVIIFYTALFMALCQKLWRFLCSLKK